MQQFSKNKNINNLKKVDAFISTIESWLNILSIEIKIAHDNLKNNFNMLVSYYNSLVKSQLYDHSLWLSKTFEKNIRNWA
ncbi:hypothetical protein MCFN_00585 [Mycoplasmopsis californica]|uniref:Uncharacterized protein n=1 Tax=Mycoplasmopsis californica TaxID=2113 RepID=A0A059XQK3_9BACT|nr:hypothetical protein MCFN_00585 [Mycoplasmopsis californica]